MSENLFNSNHKATNEPYRNNYENMVWDDLYVDGDQSKIDKDKDNNNKREKINETIFY